MFPTFRKLYGKIDSSFQSGDRLVINVEANFEVDSFDGEKSLLISTLGDLGGKNVFIGQAYIAIGSVF
ncbi:CDC50/LEM3 family protein, partial [Escherichia coli]|uniref:CDC50/LEM3 family protein n=1 Tax=Escherichia coli TaxID=562 RepID=UPI0021175A44